MLSPSGLKKVKEQRDATFGISTALSSILKKRLKILNPYDAVSCGEVHDDVLIMTIIFKYHTYNNLINVKKLNRKDCSHKRVQIFILSESLAVYHYGKF